VLCTALCLTAIVLRPVSAAKQADDSETPRIATCAIPNIVNLLMTSERFEPTREELAKELEEEMQPLVDEGRRLFEELQGASQDDPAAQAKARRLQSLQREISEKRAEATQKIEKLTAEQIVECYRLARTTAIAIAEDEGFTHVIASVGQDEELSTDSVETVLRQMVSRPMIFSPEDDDITAAVMEDLQLE